MDNILQSRNSSGETSDKEDAPRPRQHAVARFLGRGRRNSKSPEAKQQDDEFPSDEKQRHRDTTPTQISEASDSVAESQLYLEDGASSVASASLMSGSFGSELNNHNVALPIPTEEEMSIATEKRSNSSSRQLVEEQKEEEEEEEEAAWCEIKQEQEENGRSSPHGLATIPEERNGSKKVRVSTGMIDPALQQLVETDDEELLLYMTPGKKRDDEASPERIVTPVVFLGDVEEAISSITPGDSAMKGRRNSTGSAPSSAASRRQQQHRQLVQQLRKAQEEASVFRDGSSSVVRPLRVSTASSTSIMRKQDPDSSGSSPSLLPTGKKMVPLMKPSLSVETEPNTPSPVHEDEDQEPDATPKKTNKTSSFRCSSSSNDDKGESVGLYMYGAAPLESRMSTRIGDNGDYINGDTKRSWCRRHYVLVLVVASLILIAMVIVIPLLVIPRHDRNRGANANTLSAAMGSNATGVPTSSPSFQPSDVPSLIPSPLPTLLPSPQPSGSPTAPPSDAASKAPSVSPTLAPTAGLSKPPTLEPSTLPSTVPTTMVSKRPSTRPSQGPTNPTYSSPSPTGTVSWPPSARPADTDSFTPTMSTSTPITHMTSLTPTNGNLAATTDMASSPPSSTPSHSASSPTETPGRSPTANPAGFVSFTPTLSRVPSSEPKSFAPTNGNLTATEVVAIVQGAAPTVVLDPSDSPQARALSWLVEESEVPLKTEQDVLQRYSLAVLSFAMIPNIADGSNGDLTMAILHPLVPECDWIGVTCQEIGELAQPPPTGAARVVGEATSPLEVAAASDLDFTAVSTVVTELKWANAGLSGSIPPEISLLGNLRHLDLAENALYGGLPEDFFELGSLTHLYLHRNQLSGTLSENFSKLIKLEHFYAGNNRFSGNFPRGLGSRRSGGANARRLRYLSLHQNQLTGSLPNALNLRFLYYLDLSWNSFTGNIPDDWSSGKNHFVRLRHVYLDHNRFSGELPQSFPNIGNGRLEQLLLSDNFFTGVFPGNWTHRNSLQQLELQNNQFTAIGSDVCPMIVFYRGPGEMVNFRADCEVCTCRWLCDCAANRAAFP